MDAQQQAPEDVAALRAALEACEAGLRDARTRIAELEARPQPQAAPPGAELEALTAELDQARARITALEADHNASRQWWRRR